MFHNKYLVSSVLFPLIDLFYLKLISKLSNYETAGVPSNLENNIVKSTFAEIYFAAFISIILKYN